MGIVYILVVFFVTVLLVGPALYPFWKVTKLLKERHEDVWLSQGPFDFKTMIIYSTTGNLIKFIKTAHEIPAVKADKELVRWIRTCRDILKMLPRSFIAQIGYAMVFLYFVGFLTYLILGVFK